MNRKQAIRQVFLGLMCLVLLIFAGCNQFESILHEVMQDEPEVGLVW